MPRRTEGRAKNRRNGVFILSSAPSRAGVEGWPGAGKDRSGLQTSPVSWLGGSSAPIDCYYFMGPVRGLPVALPFVAGANLERGSRAVSNAPQWPRQYLFRLTVARRRRLFHVRPRCLPELTHRLPVHEVRDDCGGPAPASFRGRCELFKCRGLAAAFG